MCAVAFCSQPSMFHLSSFSALSKSKFFSLRVKEITDGPLLFACNRNIYYPVISSKQADGDGPGHTSSQNPGLGRIPKSNKNKENLSSRNREEIISLFRRIQSSISKRSENPKKKSPQPSEDAASADSDLRVLSQSRIKLKGKTARKDGNKVSARQSGSLKKEQKANNSTVEEKGLTRPPSAFVRRSPIPLSIKGVPAADPGSEQVPTKDDKKEMQTPELKELSPPKFEDMKLPELKELAKSKGIKGYSKLRKAELVKLLVPS